MARVERREALSIPGAQRSPGAAKRKGRGSEHAAGLGYASSGAAQAGLTEGAERSSRLLHETNVEWWKDQPEAAPIGYNTTSRPTRMTKKKTSAARSARSPRNLPTVIPIQQVISLGDQVRGAITAFLDGEAMSCPITAEGLVLLVNALSHYTEEGRELFPEVFLVDDLESVLKVMPGHQQIPIGYGPKNALSMSRALKKCAPLARLGWSVYIERQKKTFSYGLFRYGTTMLALGAAELLVDQGDPAIPVLMLRQVSRNVIELKGVSKASLLIHFGATRYGESSPSALINKFVTAITRDVASDHQEQTAAFYRRIMSVVTHAGHGTLASVVGRRKRVLPPQFQDAIVIDPPLAVPLSVSDLLKVENCPSNTQLLAYNALITGMLLSDGITVFGSDGTVRAYNVFVRHPRQKSAEATAGGARHRTYSVLSFMVEEGILEGAFMQSQDGRVETCGRKTK